MKLTFFIKKVLYPLNRLFIFIPVFFLLSHSLLFSSAKFDIKDINLPFPENSFYRPLLKIQPNVSLWREIKRIEKNSFLELPYDTSKKDSTKKDSTRKTIPNPWNYQLKDDGFQHDPGLSESELFLKNPSNIKTEINVDSSLENYSVDKKIGNKINYRSPSTMTYDEFSKLQMRNSIKNYWKEKARSEEVVSQKGVIPKLPIPKVFDRIFGGNYVDIRPNGSALLTFAASHNRNQDPNISEEQRSHTGFNFDQQIQMNVIGNIGEKLKITANWDTQANFDFENQLKLEYTGYEEEIIQKIEAGNVSLPLNSSLITGAQNLFGIKTQLRFGRLTVTALASQQKGKKEEIEVEGGAQSNTFEIRADEYDANRHFFLGQFFREQYDTSLIKLPFINSPYNVTRVEVWVTNKRNTAEGVRNALGFQDLGEPVPYLVSLKKNGVLLPENNANILYQKIKDNPDVRIAQKTINALNLISIGTDSLIQAQDFQKIDNARKLQANEFKIQPQLGYISLNASLNSDEALAVAYEYTYAGKNYQVGEFSQDVPPTISEPNVLFLKLLKSVTVRTDLPMWNLMMKNIYSIGAYQVNKQDFQLNIYFKDDRTGFNLPVFPSSAGVLSGQRIIEILNLDKLNTNNDVGKDGVFDFIENYTIDANNGRVIFPVLEPFGNNLKVKFNGDNAASSFVFEDLYKKTKSDAQQNAELNKYYLKGKYLSSSSSEIPLNAINVIKGSVVVSAGTTPLTENQDYTVDYTLGRVKIINQAILTSGQKVSVKFETNSFFTIQSKSLIGSRFDYKINEDFNVGGAFLKLHERPLTPKIDIGQEPISNTIWGLDLSWKKESQFITKALDKLPFLTTKKPSSILFNAEFAQLLPGHPSSIEDKKGEAKAYIDDFESSKIPFDMQSQYSWKLASTPQRFAQKYSLSNPLQWNYDRAKLAWYTIDPLFFRDDNSATPKVIKGNKELLSRHYNREVLPREVFPKRDETVGETNLATLDIAYYPTKRGPYNYALDLDENGHLKNPEKRWGGVMKAIISTTDFEAANIEFIEFWLLDPFIQGTHGGMNNTGGDFYMNLGNVSEDLLKDSRKAFEDGLPKTTNVSNVDTTFWGRVSTLQSIAHAFDNQGSSRQFQDLGLDGLNDLDEQSFFDSVYLDTVRKIVTNPTALDSILQDPSADNYHYYRGSDIENLEILPRYLNYNNMQGNSPSEEQNKEDYATSATYLPDDEDINKDNTLNEMEEYFEYKMHLTPGTMTVGQNYITDRVKAPVELANGETDTISWYQFRIPINNPTEIIGNIRDFKSIRFMRMYLTGFKENVVFRFARFQLIGGSWRRYNQDLFSEGAWVPPDGSQNTAFSISTVNIEDNGTFDGSNIPYVLPPGIQQEIEVASVNQRKMNEQALELCVTDLLDGDAKAAYKNISMDFRTYKKFKMFIHAENKPSPGSVPFTEPGQLNAFVRLGTDFTQNYYEYEIPLHPTQGPVDPTSTDAEGRIWRYENDLDILFDALGVVKALRNDEKMPLDKPYSISRGGNIITIRGNPDLAAVKTIMIGIRNPKDDGQNFSGCIWVNEMRVTDFKEEAGWASTGRLQANLADVGTFIAAGNHSTAGFGSIDTKISTRSKVNATQYDLSTSLELAKFIPESFSVRIPMYATYGETTISPQFDPLNQDVLMSEKLTNYVGEERERIENEAIDYTERRSLSFTNVQRVRKPSKKVHLYDVENLAATVSYNDNFNRNINYERNFTNQYRGSLGYNYINPTIKNYQPFGKIQAFNPPRYKLIKDFNYSLFPKNLGFRSDMDRKFNESKLRSPGDVEMEYVFNKSFNWDRVYDLKWDITKGLKLDYNAVNNARIDEPMGRIDTKEKKDSVWQEVFRYGRTTRYNQTTSLDYRVPLDKISFLNWVSGNVRYTGGYTWDAAPIGQETLGNVIQNSEGWNYNGNINLTSLYNKSSYLKSINTAPTGTSGTPPPAPGAKKDTVKKVSDNKYFRKVLRALMTIRTINWSYTINKGSLLPGYMPSTKYFGLDNRRDNEVDFTNAPGLGYVLGFQDENIHQTAAKKKYLTLDTNLNSKFTLTNRNNLNIRTSFEPFSEFKVDFTWTRSDGVNREEFFRYDPILEEFVSQSPRNTRTYSVSYNTWATSLMGDDTLNNNEAFSNFSAYIPILKSRVNNLEYNPKYSQGVTEYGDNSNEVIIPAFLSAYRGTNAENISIDYFPPLLFPQWKLTYGGLSKIPWAKEYFRSVNFTHGYSSTYTVGSAVTSLYYNDKDNNGKPTTARDDGIFYSEYVIDAVSIREQYSPLAGLDFAWKNDVTTRFEIKKTRDLTLSLSNSQVTETRRTEFMIGLGYRKAGFTAPFNFRGKQLTLKNDLTFKIDLSYSVNRTIQRIVNSNPEPTSGQSTIKFSPSIDYVVNQRLKVRIFYDTTRNTPLVSTSYPNTYTLAGFEIRFTLTQ